MQVTQTMFTGLLLFCAAGCKTTSLSSPAAVQSEFVNIGQQWKPGDIIKVTLTASQIEDIHYARVAFTGPAEIVPFQTMRKVGTHMEVIFEVPKRNRFDSALLAFEIFDNAGHRTILYPHTDRFKAAGLDLQELDVDAVAGDDTEYVDFDAPIITGMSYDDTAPELVSARLSPAGKDEGLFEYVVKDEGLVTANVEVGIEGAVSDELGSRRLIARTDEGFLSMCNRTTDDLLTCRVKLPIPSALPAKPYVRLMLEDLQGHESVSDSTDEPKKFSISWPVNQQLDDAPVNVTSVKVLEQTQERLRLEVQGSGGGGLVHLDMVVGSGIDIRTLQPRDLTCVEQRCVAEFVLPGLKNPEGEPEADVRVYGANGTSALSEPVEGVDFRVAGSDLQPSAVGRIKFERASKNELLGFF